MNRRQANQLRGKINRYSRDKAYAAGTVTVEVNPHGTSQYCSRCGAQGERFSYLGGKRIQAKWGKLFWCPVCQYEANADFNASVNVHRSFYREWHWQPRKKPPPRAVMEAARSLRLQVGGKKRAFGTPRSRLGSQAGCFATCKVVRLSLVQREDVPVCILSRTTPEWIASPNAAGTLGRLDSFRAARTTVSGFVYRFGFPLIPHFRWLRSPHHTIAQFG